MEASPPDHRGGNKSQHTRHHWRASSSEAFSGVSVGSWASLASCSETAVSHGATQHPRLPLLRIASPRNSQLPCNKQTGTVKVNSTSKAKTFFTGTSGAALFAGPCQRSSVAHPHCLDIHVPGCSLHPCPPPAYPAKQHRTYTGEVTLAQAFWVLRCFCKFSAISASNAECIVTHAQKTSQLAVLALFTQCAGLHHKHRKSSCAWNVGVHPELVLKATRVFRDPTGILLVETFNCMMILRVYH